MRHRRTMVRTFSPRWIIWPESTRRESDNESELETDYPVEILNDLASSITLIRTCRLRANCSLQHLPDGMRKAINSHIHSSSNQYLIPLQTNILSPRKGFTMRHCLLAVWRFSPSHSPKPSPKTNLKHPLSQARRFSSRRCRAIFIRLLRRRS